MPQLNKLVDKYKNKNVVFLALTFNDSEIVKTFLKTHVFNYTVISGSRNIDKEYQVSLWPTSFVIGGDSKVKIALGTEEHIDLTLSKQIESALASM